MQTKLLVIASCLTVLGLLAASCAPAAGPAPAKAPEKAAAPAEAPAAPQPTTPSLTPKPVAEQPKYGGTLRYVLLGTMTHFDPYMNTSSATFTFIMPAYSQLVQFDPLAQGKKIVGDVAKSWEMEGELTWVFRLNQGVKFHDGGELTSEDVKYSLDLVRNPPQGMRIQIKDLYGAIDKIETPDKYTVRIVTKHPWPSGLTMLAQGMMMIVPKKAYEKAGDFKKVVLGTGPYKFKEYTADVGGKMVKNTEYFVPGRPYVDVLQGFIIPDAQTRAAALATGALDIYTENLEMAQVQAIKKARPGIVIDWPMDPIQGQEFSINATRPPFNDIRVRKAVSLAIDRRELYKTLGYDCPFVWDSPMGYNSVWSLSQEELAKRLENTADRVGAIAEAKKLVAEAGYATGFETSILIGQGKALYGAPIQMDAEALYIAEALKQLDIKAKIKDTPYPNPFIEHANKVDYDMIAFRTSYQGYPDPDGLKATWRTKGGRNYSGYSDMEMDDLLNRQSLILDFEKRKDLVSKIQRKAMDSYSALHFPIPDPKCGATRLMTARQEWVGNFKNDWVGSRYDNKKFQDVWIDPALKR